MASAVSIVQMLTRREQSSSNFGILLHQDYGYRKYYTWNGGFGNRSFERRFRSYNYVMAFFTSITSGTLEGMCSCITCREEFFNGDPGTLIDVLFDKITPCRVFLPPLPDWLDGPWSTVRQERELQEADAGKTRCTCNAT
jgi:hypothetical protein